MAYCVTLDVMHLTSSVSLTRKQYNNFVWSKRWDSIFYLGGETRLSDWCTRCRPIEVVMALSRPIDKLELLCVDSPERYIRSGAQRLDAYNACVLYRPRTLVVCVVYGTDACVTKHV